MPTLKLRGLEFSSVYEIRHGYEESWGSNLKDLKMGCLIFLESLLCRCRSFDDFLGLPIRAISMPNILPLPRFAFFRQTSSKDWSAISRRGAFLGIAKTLTWLKLNCCICKSLKKAWKLTLVGLGLVDVYVLRGQINNYLFEASESFEGRGSPEMGLFYASCFNHLYIG